MRFRVLTSLWMMLWASPTANPFRELVDEQPPDYQEISEHRLSPRPYIRGGELPPKAIDVRVVINAQGEVESAVAVGGPEAFRKQAEMVERAQHFKPFQRDGKAVAVSTTDFVWLAVAEDWISPRVTFPEIKDWQSIRIKLERRRAFSEASYTVELRGNGNVIFNGFAGWRILIAGHHSDSVSEGSIRRLMAGLREADFFSIKDSYSCAYVNPDSYRISVEFDGHQKEISDEGDPLCGKPEAVTTAEDLIDEVTESAKWVEGTADTAPSLLREHWDFRANTCDNDFVFLAAASRPEILRLYSERGFPPIDSPKNCLSPLVSAAGSADTSVLARLIGNRRRLPGRLARMALSSASIAGLAGNIRMLLEHGASPDGEENGTTVLEYAVWSGKVDAVNEILKYHPDIRGRDRAGHGVMSFLMDHDVPAAAKEEMIPILIEAGADVNARGGLTDDKPLFLLSENRNCPALLKLLVAGGARVNAREGNGYSPLMAVGKNVDCAKALIAEGADLAARNKKGETALDVARGGKNNEVAAVIAAAMTSQKGRVN